MDLFTIAAGTGIAAFLFKTFKKGKAAANLGVNIESVRLVKWSTGYAVVGVSFRFTNSTSTDILLKSFSTKVKFINTIIATGAQVIDEKIKANSDTIIEFQINSSNYTTALLSLIYDIFTTSDKKLNIQYCVTIEGLPQYCDEEIYTL